MTETYASIVDHLRAGVYTCAAGGTILLYDIIITSEDEIRLIWASQFSLVKCLYFVVSLPLILLGIAWPTSPVSRIAMFLSRV
jgi:Family of unknown function (DUF6533)